MNLTRQKKQELLLALLEKRKLKRRRRVGVVLLLLALVLVLLLLRCPSEETLPGIPQPTPLPVAHEVEAAPRASVKKSNRKPLRLQTTRDPEWLRLFRRQISQVSRELRLCLPDAPSPGHVRWTVLVNRKLGQLSDHEFSGMGDTPDPGKEEMECLVDVLNGVPLRNLDQGKITETNETLRVALVLEL